MAIADRPDGLTSKQPVFRKIERFLRTHRLILAGDRVLAGVSGGADSVLLLHALHALAIPLEIQLHVGHLNHGWRGAEAEEDARFVRALASTLGVPFHTKSIDAKALASAARRSPEEGARDARYSFFAETSTAHGLTVIATGHSKDDDVETVLLAWLRGSGLAGLQGISRTGTLAPAGVRMVRPLLELTAAEIRRTLRSAGVAWREDSTNREVMLPRNRVRHELIPQLEAITPGFRETILRSAGLTRQAADYMSRQADRHAAELFIGQEEGLRADRNAFLATDPALWGLLLIHAIRTVKGNTRDVESAHVTAATRVIVGGRDGARVQLAQGIQLRLTRGQILIHPG